MVFNDVNELGTLDEIRQGLQRKRVREMILVLVLQISGAIALVVAGFLLHVAAGLAVLGCCMLAFGIAVERGLYAG